MCPEWTAYLGRRETWAQPAAAGAGKGVLWFSREQGYWGPGDSAVSSSPASASTPILLGLSVIWLALFCPSNSAQGHLCSTLGLPPGVLTVRQDTPEEGSVD